MGTYSEADRMRYLEGDSKAFSFFKVDTMEEQGKSKQQYKLKSRRSQGGDTLFTQSETFSNLGTMSDVFTESEMEQSRSSTRQAKLPGDKCRLPDHESTDTIIDNRHTTLVVGSFEFTSKVIISVNFNCFEEEIKRYVHVQ